VLPEVVREAHLVIVEDWIMGRVDDRRLTSPIGRTGELVGPDGDAFAGPARTGPIGPLASSARRVDASPGRGDRGLPPWPHPPDQVVLSNPFGMGILDVALASAVAEVAERSQLGVVLER